MPASVLKNVTKNTKVAARTTLELVSMPNQIMSNGASAILGILLSATKNGSKTSANPEMDEPTCQSAFKFVRASNFACRITGQGISSVYDDAMSCCRISLPARINPVAIVLKACLSTLPTPVTGKSAIASTLSGHLNFASPRFRQRQDPQGLVPFRHIGSARTFRQNSMPTKRFRYRAQATQTE
jgi:hypothetical protein